MKKLLSVCSIIVCVFQAFAATAPARSDDAISTRVGYYRHPAIYYDTVVFVAEGDLWKGSIDGGVAYRLTTHPGLESYPAISPDGRLVAFTGQYEGQTDIYVMPLAGGLPTRLTYFGRRADVAGWTPDNKVICATWHYSTLPSRQLITIDPTTGEQTRIPLGQAAEGCYDETGQTLFFTRFPFQGSYTKRYKGGTAQNLWKFQEGQPEAVPLTTDYAGMSNSPMWYKGRIYFVSDRDGIMNLWSMDQDGGDLRQETSHLGWDVKSPSLSNGKIVYQMGAALHLFDIEKRTERLIPITLASDFDQLREQWISEPLDYLTAAHLSHDGEKVVITARGDLFVVPRKNGRLVEATHNSGVRYRSARFLPESKSLVALSDASGELEFWKIPANGLGEPAQITDNGTVFRFDGIPSPDGKYLAFGDKDQKLWIHDVERGITTLIDTSETEAHSDITWSPDSRWLAYVKPAINFLGQIFIYSVENGRSVAVTNDRHLDHDPAWSTDGNWLYFISDRDVSSVFPGVWTLNQPFPLVDKMCCLYMLPLQPGLRSPFIPDDEVNSGKTDSKSDDSKLRIDIDFTNIQQRVLEVPAPSGNYGSLTATDKQLFWLSWERSSAQKRSLQTIEIKSDEPEVKTLTDNVVAYELSGDGKRMLIRKDKALYVTDAPGTSDLDLGKSKIDLSGWNFAVKPAHEWRQMFIDAWRLERDYFYDPGMHGVNWDAIRDKYLPLVDRITDRHELSDLLGEMVGELSSLHIYVFGGDSRHGNDKIDAAFLGGLLARDEGAGGYRVDYIYRSDPDKPQLLSPLAQPGVDISEGDIITEVNGISTLSVNDIQELLRRTADKQVLLTVYKPSLSDTRKSIVKPISVGQARNLRYRDWEYTRRLKVDDAGNNELGYVHLRATSTGDYGQWVSEFYPIINRKGLIVDMRNNNGGNIDSWILTTLLRHPWAYWQSRVGVPYPNMQSSFNGHIVVLCNEWTVSDGELFCEGIRRLGLGKVIGTRTLGGEIWLSYSNVMVDEGIATAAESGVFGPEGEWLIEGHGFEPDIVVDNLPHATFSGSDAQLDAAIEYLKEQIRLNPPQVPIVPEYPDKSLKSGQ